VGYNVKLVFDEAGNGHLVAIGNLQFGDSVRVDYSALPESEQVVSVDDGSGDKTLMKKAGEAPCNCMKAPPPAEAEAEADEPSRHNVQLTMDNDTGDAKLFAIANLTIGDPVNIDYTELNKMKAEIISYGGPDKSFKTYVQPCACGEPEGAEAEAEAQELPYNAKMEVDTDGNAHLVVTGSALSRGDMLYVDYGDLVSKGSIAWTKDRLNGDKIMMGAHGTFECNCEQAAAPEAEAECEPEAFNETDYNAKLVMDEESNAYLSPPPASIKAMHCTLTTPHCAWLAKRCPPMMCTLGTRSL